MQALLDDIELDIQELKCVMEALSREPNKVLREVAKRNILQMRGRLDTMLKELDIAPLPPSPPPQPPPPQQQQQQPQQPEVVLATTALVSKDVVVAPVIPIAEVEMEVQKSVSILTEQIKPMSDLRRSISLNDSFRFSRELFGGDSERMNVALQRMGEMNSLDEAITYLATETGGCDEENEAMIDLLELLKKFFN